MTIFALTLRKVATSTLPHSLDETVHGSRGHMISITTMAGESSKAVTAPTREVALPETQGAYGTEKMAKHVVVSSTTTVGSKDDGL